MGQWVDKQDQTACYSIGLCTNSVNAFPALSYRDLQPVFICIIFLITMGIRPPPPPPITTQFPTQRATTHSRNNLRLLLTSLSLSPQMGNCPSSSLQRRVQIPLLLLVCAVCTGRTPDPRFDPIPAFCLLTTYITSIPLSPLYCTFRNRDWILSCLAHKKQHR